MRTTCICGIAILALVLAGCFGGDDEDKSSLLGGLAQAMQQQQQMEQQAQLQAQQQAEAMRAQMLAEMQGQGAALQPPTAAPVAPAAPAAPGMTGVPECDEYLTKYPACLESKVPAMAKPQMMAGFEATKQAWMQMAANPQTRGTLQMTCKMALDQAKMAMQIYGCQF